MKTGFVGAGKVGFTLGKFLREQGKQVTGYYSRNTHSAEEAAQFTGSAAYVTLARLVEDSDVLFLTVPDSSITSVYEDICRYLIRGKYICHCSGALSSEAAFPGIDDTGAYAYSVHPLFAVSDKFSAYRELPDVFFTIEGEQSQLPGFQSWLEGMGLRVRAIDPAAKTRYHAAAAMASNLVTGLLVQSAQVFVESGAAKDLTEALSAMAPLIRRNVERVLREGPVASLTGPVERGDVSTVQKHLTVLETADERDVYIALSRQLVTLAKEKHPERSYDTIQQLLSKAGQTARDQGGDYEKHCIDFQRHEG